MPEKQKNYFTLTLCSQTKHFFPISSLMSSVTNNFMEVSFRKLSWFWRASSTMFCFCQAINIITTWIMLCTQL